jgi:opacity protein-like surface antigen
MKSFLAAASLVAGLLGGVASANADAITWDLQNVTMSGGTSLKGYITTDDSGNLLSYNVAMVGGPYGGGIGYLFQTGIPTDYIVTGGPMDFRVANGGASYFLLDLADALSSALYTDDVDFSEFYCLACGQYVVEGETGRLVRVPEPSSASLLPVGLLGLTFLAWRRSRKSAVVR